MKMIDYTPYNIDSEETEDIKLECSAMYHGMTGYIFYPRYIFDNNPNTAWNYEDQKPPVGGHYIKIIFKNNPVCINHIALSNGSIASTSINKFELFGSNDDIDYTLLLNDSHPYGDTDTTVKKYSFTNKYKYKYYRLNILNSHYFINNTYGGIGELRLYQILNNYLIYKDSRYFNVDDTNYNHLLQQYDSITPTSNNLTELFINNYLNLDELTIDKTIGEETFKPIDKLLPFRIQKLE